MQPGELLCSRWSLQNIALVLPGVRNRRRPHSLGEASFRGGCFCPPLASSAQARACSRLFYEKSAKTDCPTDSLFTFQKEGHLVFAAVDPRRDLILDRVGLLSRDRLLPLLPQLPDKIPYGIGIDSVV